MKRLIAIGVLVGTVCLGLGISVPAQEEEEGFATEEAVSTLQGEVIDPALYLREGRHGPEMEELIYEAADSGQTLALLENGTEMLYLFLAEEPAQDPNDLVYEYAGKRVRVTGAVYERGGLKGMVVTAVEPLDEFPVEELEGEAEETE
jgi:hypothetical protein